MSTPRTFWGHWLDGSFRLRCSLNGYDAINDNSDIPDRFSFDSSWPDLVKIHSAGSGAKPDGSAGLIAFADLGYTPFVEMRLKSGDTIYDDRFLSDMIGVSSQIRSNSLTIIGVPGAFPGRYDGPFEYAYVIYKIPAVFV